MTKHIAHKHTGPARRRPSRVGDVVADINRGGNIRDPANVLVQAGKDAVRSVLIAVGIDEACRLRPRAVYDGVTFKDKFDKEYQRDDDESADGGVWVVSAWCVGVWVMSAGPGWGRVWDSCVISSRCALSWSAAHVRVRPTASHTGMGTVATA